MFEPTADNINAPFPYAQEVSIVSEILNDTSTAVTERKWSNLNITVPLKDANMQVLDFPERTIAFDTYEKNTRATRETVWAASDENYIIVSFMALRVTSRVPITNPQLTKLRIRNWQNAYGKVGGNLGFQALCPRNSSRCSMKRASVRGIIPNFYRGSWLEDLRISKIEQLWIYMGPFTEYRP